MMKVKNNIIILVSIITLLFLQACIQQSVQQMSFILSTNNFTSQSSNNSVDLRPLMTPVKFQGQRGTCNAFAATALMEFLIKAKTSQNIDLSEAYNYWAGKKYTLDSDFLRKSYEHSDGLAGFMAVKAYKFGSMLEKEWPYEPRNWLQTNNSGCKIINNEPCTECFAGTPPAGAKLLPYRIEPIFIERTKIAGFILTNKKPVVFNLLWCSDAVNDNTGDFRMPTEQDLKNSAGHVITFVGYDSVTKRFIFKNSFGLQWGNKGYGTVPEEYVIKYCEICPYLSSVNTYTPEEKEFVLTASMGVSGNLTEMNP